MIAVCFFILRFLRRSASRQTDVLKLNKMTKEPNSSCLWAHLLRRPSNVPPRFQSARRIALWSRMAEIGRCFSFNASHFKLHSYYLGSKTLSLAKEKIGLGGWSHYFCAYLDVVHCCHVLEDDGSSDCCEGTNPPLVLVVLTPIHVSTVRLKIGLIKLWVERVIWQNVQFIPIQKEVQFRDGFFVRVSGPSILSVLLLMVYFKITTITSITSMYCCLLPNSSLIRVLMS